MKTPAEWRRTGRLLAGMRARPLALWLALATMLAAVPAWAHQFWLAPSQYDATPGQTVQVSASAGTGFRGERKPWSPSHVIRFVARTAHDLDLTRAATIGDLVWARFAASDSGGAMLACESSFSPIELPAGQFDAYLADEGLTGPLEVRRRAGASTPGRERFRRCAKTWLGGRDAGRATRPLGLPLEIVSESVPGTAPSLRVLVLWNGHPLPGALVKMWCASFAPGGGPTEGADRDSIGVLHEVRADGRGQATVRCERPGEWLVSVVHMVPCPEPAEADWESTWSSLTFARPLSGAKSR